MVVQCLDFLLEPGRRRILTRFDVVCPMVGFLAGTGADAAFMRLA